ncbi:MAG: tRNA (adenosine(37)-N6)-threonylcarbamoyltransferase complex ATPase subunit type 1 TsaE [Pseudomonadota bacterium]
MRLRLWLPDEPATEEFGAVLATTLLPAARRSAGGCTLFLHGGLGAGKTALVRAMLRAAGVTGAVPSPTYTLLESYVLDEVEVQHFDLYRLGDAEELEFIGARDYFDGASLRCVEWPERGAGALSEPTLSVHLAVVGQGREVRVEVVDSVQETLLEGIHKLLIEKNIESILNK